MSDRSHYVEGLVASVDWLHSVGKRVPIPVVVLAQEVETSGGRVYTFVRDGDGDYYARFSVRIRPDSIASKADARVVVETMERHGMRGEWNGYQWEFSSKFDLSDMPRRRNPTITRARPDARRGVASPALRGASVQTILQRPSNYDPAHLTQVLRPADVARLVAHLGALDQEVSLVLALDQRKRVIAVHEAGKGGADSVPLSRRTLVKVPLLAGARGVVTVHNHPSGDAMPSKADIRIARARAASLQCAGLELLDSIVIGSNRYQSLREMKLLPGAKLAGGKYRWSK